MIEEIKSRVRYQVDKNYDPIDEGKAQLLADLLVSLTIRE